MRSAAIAVALGALGAAGASLGACSSDTFSPDDAGTDAPLEATVDGAPDAGTFCDPDTAFQSFAAVATLNSGQPDFRVTFDEGELHAVLTRNSRVVGDASFAIPELWLASRPTINDTFSTPTRVSELNSATGMTLDPTLSPDGLMLYFASYRQGETQGADILVATRPSSGGAFGQPTIVAPLATISEEFAPYFVPGKAIYFTRNQGGNGELYRAPITNGNVGTPVAITELNTPDDERYPVVSDDELLIYFSRRIVANVDIFVARRQSVNDPFGAPTPVAALNLPVVDDYPAWLSRDRCVLYFNSTRAGGGDLYRAVRNK